MDFEVVLENIEEALLAQQFGVKRVELCAGLDLGGLTPSQGAIETFTSTLNCETHVMIRPRAGGFIYDRHEIDLMQKDISLAAKAGCHGVVFGLVNDKRQIAVNEAAFLNGHAKSLGLETTFHRAIDFTEDIFQSIEQVAEIGFTRILTSGGHNTVDLGLESLQNIYQAYKGQIQLMAGGGIHFGNAKTLIASGIDAIHFNVRKAKAVQSNPLMGTEYELDHAKIREITGITNQPKP